jgi:hypothetical protein
MPNGEQNSIQAGAGFTGKSNGPYLYNYARSAYNNWWFIYVADVNTVVKELNTLRNISIVIGVIVLFGVIITASSRARFFINLSISQNPVGFGKCS